MIQPKEALGLVKEGKAVFIDVREAEELQESGILEGALWMPTSKMHSDEPDWVRFKEQLPREKVLAIYCRSGQRSGRVAESLKLDGYDARNLGGFKDCKAAGLPTAAF